MEAKSGKEAWCKIHSNSNDTCNNTGDMEVTTDYSQITPFKEHRNCRCFRNFGKWCKEVNQLFHHDPTKISLRKPSGIQINT